MSDRKAKNERRNISALRKSQSALSAVTSNFELENPLGFTEIFNEKVLSKQFHDLGPDRKKRGGNESDCIINVSTEVKLSVSSVRGSAVERPNAMIEFQAKKAKGNEEVVKGKIPHPRSLFKSIKTFHKTKSRALQVGVLEFISLRNADINGLIELGVNEGVLKVHLENFPVASGGH